MRILLVEDDKALCDTLYDVLSAEGIEIESAYNGKEAFEKLFTKHYEILLLDIDIPYADGFTILEEAHQYNPKIGALFMTALDTPTNLEKSFQKGADDYIRKPFTITELLLRLKAIYKRLHSGKSEIIAIDDTFSFDLVHKRLLYKNEEYDLSPKLKKLLYILARHANVTVEKGVIEETLWENEELPDPAIIRIYIKELRKILGKEHISTIKGVGYRLETL
ncbi:response regulator transcription factor [Nitratiruptor sp. YY09-18]|uniref:response regulator transcription factor n=1 Tax=Nitratiruptor sp. YY09-18 TaxID=2724901 RepID=UPI00191549CF|nr:response regulator transcription factor [Nitratiruptor sp. YY09-18]BCD67143.1 two-component system response regulator [Nitratiruptor sp. YY09-18]